MSSHKQREIITINCGGCGLKIGEQTLQQFAVEYGYQLPSSNTTSEATLNASTSSVLFDETMTGKYTSRSLFADLDPQSIHNIKTRSCCRSLLNPDCLVNGNRDASCNFAIGHYNQDKDIYETMNNAIRKLMEAANNVQGFIFNHSISGGSGGGLGTRILQTIATDYKKKIRVGMNVMFDDCRTCGAMEIYNSLLTMHHIRENMDVEIIFDNKACHDICTKVLDIDAPNYRNYNNLITKLVGDITAASRFGINETLSSLYMDMVATPELKFLVASMWPLIPQNKPHTIFKNDIQSITTRCAESENFVVHAPDFDVEEDRSIAVSFCYRGSNINKYMSDINKCMDFMNTDKKISYTEFNASKPMAKCIDSKAAQLPSDDMIVTDKQVSMLMNNMWIRSFFEERICKQYDILYSNKCYLHHYLMHGMEREEFHQARESLGLLQGIYYHYETGYFTESEESD
eukprot:162044_1